MDLDAIDVVDDAIDVDGDAERVVHEVDGVTNHERRVTNDARRVDLHVDPVDRHVDRVEHDARRVDLARWVPRRWRRPDLVRTLSSPGFPWRPTRVRWRIPTTLAWYAQPMVTCEACRAMVHDSETFYRQDGARICRGCHDVEDMGAATRRANAAAVPAWLTGAATLWFLFGLMRGQVLFMPLGLLVIGFALTSYSFWQKGRA